MYDEKNIEETTWGEICWSALRGVLIGALAIVPLALLAFAYGDAISAFLAGFN